MTCGQVRYQANQHPPGTKRVHGPESSADFVLHAQSDVRIGGRGVEAHRSAEPSVASVRNQNREPRDHRRQAHQGDQPLR